MVNNMDHGLPKFSLLGYDDWKIMMEAHLYALHDCMWMVLEDGPLKIQMENSERNPATPDVIQYIPKPKEKWDDRDCKKHNLDNVAKAAIFKALDPITFSKIKHLKTAMEIWQGLGKLCEGSEDLRKQKIEVLLEKFKGFKMLPGESFDMLDERFHKILNDLASLNHVLSPKEKNVRLLRSLPTEWYTKATAMEEGRNLENYTVQGLLDELRTYEHELKKKKEEQVTPFPTALMTTSRIPSRLNYNLLSISQFCDKGYSLEFCKNMASLKNISTNEVILTGKRIRNIYEVIWSDVKEACLISKAQGALEAAAEDFQTLPETSHVSKMVLTEVVEEKATSPPQEQNQETAEEEEFQPLIQSQVLEILTTPCEISKPAEIEIPEKSAEIPEQSALPETMEQAVEAQRNSGEAEKETQMAELEVSQTPVAIFEEENTAEERDSLSRDISNFALEAEGESERTLKVTDEEDVQEDAESLPLQLFQRTPPSHQVTNFHFHSSSTPTLPDEIPEIWTKKVQGLIESALASQHASFRQEIEQMEVRHTQLIEKSKGKHSADLKEISKSVQKTLEIISLLSETVSNTMEIYASDSQLQLKEINKVREQIASVTVSLQKQMSLLQMDIRSALAVASANKVVTKDYLKVIIDNQKEAYKLFRLIGANSGNRKMEVILQQHSPSPIPQLPIAVKEGEVSYIPSHLNLTNLILEAQQRNPENSAQLLSSSGLDGTEFIGTVVDHFSNDAQSEERRENLRRIKELCGNMKGISEVVGSSKRKRN
ncbi:unnamed protein product [Cuscuta campestris]|uniref:DUF4219 domain-containing protein n=1 Tax=Cuscuta campestris TaxID=132261 RepID=A0A484M3T2_9ASTE|nr:unnamed protein product [Cuscuta campestris]